MNWALALLMLWMLPTSVEAGQATANVSDLATEVQPWLTLSVDPRSAAMGGAVVASSGDVQALHNNPAGLNILDDPEIAFTHNELDTSLGLRQEYLSFGRPWAGGGIAISLSDFSYGSFDNRDSSGASLGASTDQAYAGALGYGTGFLANRLSLGLCLEASQEALGSSISTLYDASLGAMFEILPSLSLGAQMSHLGLFAQGGAAPTALDLGVSWSAFSRNLTLAGDWTKPNLGTAAEAIGAEWKILDAYCLRAGWRFNSGDPQAMDQGFSAGAGAKFGPLMINYAYVPYGNLSSSQRVSIILDLSEGLFGGNIIIEGSGVTQNAEVEYAEGKAAYGKGDWYVAKVSLNRSLKILPQSQHSDEIKRTLLDIEKKIQADRSRGVSEEQKKKIASKLSQARSFSEAGELSKARSEVEAVLEFDSEIKEAVALRIEIDSKSKIRIAGLVQEAIDALSTGDLQLAVMKYREILKVDDADPTAMSSLRKLAPRIREEVKNLHRRGIDLYVNSDIQGAIAVWSKALELDPTDPNFIRRDIDKAKKLIELRTE